MTFLVDPQLPHQMKMVVDREQDLIAVSCNCMGDGDGRFMPLVDPARNLDPKAANAAYDAHLKEVSGP